MTVAQIENAEQLLHQTFDDIWNDNKKIFHIDKLVQQIDALRTAIQTVGNYSQAELANNHSLSKEEQLKYNAIIFSWLPDAKDYLIAWRDIVFQQYKGNILLNDKQLNSTDLAHFKAQTAELMSKAKADLVTSFQSHLNAHLGTAPYTKRQLRQWVVQKNPYSIYKSQINEVANQSHYCLDSFYKIVDEQLHFQRIEKLIAANIEKTQAQLKDLKNIVSELVDHINSVQNADTTLLLGRIIHKVEDAESKLLFDSPQRQYDTEVASIVKDIKEKIEVPVATAAGMLSQREVVLKRRVNQWIQAEITPLMYEVWELSDGLMNSARMILINLKNQMTIMATRYKEGQTVEDERFSAISVSNSFLVQLDNQLIELQNLGATITKRLENEFQISNLFNLEQPFLRTETQASINQLMLNQNRFGVTIQAWIQRQKKRFVQFQSNVEKEEQLSVSEKVVRYIKTRKNDAFEGHYQSIFLTKGYVGEAFWVGREDEIQRVSNVIDHWRNGFRGAVLVTGNRMSGKSLFGEIVSKRFFFDHAFRLSPNSQIEIGGRKMETGYDLEKILAPIKNFSLDKAILIWIDDLELWWDLDVSLNQNIRTLKKFMDAHAHQIFFVVSMSSAFKAHINTLHEIDKVFQAEIHMDNLSYRELEKAISIRHGATHKTLCNDKGEILTPAQFSKIVRKIYKSADGNVGESLVMWASSIEQIDENLVNSRWREDYGLPDFLNPSIATLLSSIILQKRTNEYRLRKRFGPAFNNKYASIIKRMIGVGILQKNIDNWLEVNEVVANQVEKLLIRKSYLLEEKSDVKSLRG